MSGPRTWEERCHEMAAELQAAAAGKPANPANRSTDEWRELAEELANVASELVTVARAVAGDTTDDWARHILTNHADGVAEVVERMACAPGGDE
jgi:hypothetical protein